jgi:sporulation protein YlmC with PRC-barrel domain
MTEFTLGARASCSDGACGVVSGTILDPAARTVTHLVIEPQHGTGGRLVPLDLVEERAGEVRLRCTLDEFGRLDPAEEVLEKVTHILLEEGHLWGRKQVVIPVSAVASVDDGIRLNITKQQVEDLPPLDQPG